jgi:hypothetical protein
VLDVYRIEKALKPLNSVCCRWSICFKGPKRMPAWMEPPTGPTWDLGRISLSIGPTVNEAVLNRTVLFLPACHPADTSNSKAKKQSHQATLASVKEEMAEPRVAGSAKIEADRQGIAAVKEAAKA